MKGFLLGLVLGVLLIPASVLLYLHFGHPPVAVADKPLPLEGQIAGFTLHSRIDAQAPKNSPIEPSQVNLLAGAVIYRQQCAACHGMYPTASAFADDMYPQAPQLWKPEGNGVVGVSDDPVGETFWKVDNGIRLSGMPSFRKVLIATQEWQVALLLANANKPLPPQVISLLQQPLYAQPIIGNGAAAPVPTTEGTK